MDNKLSVKFESGLFEQTYKFRESDYLSDLASMKKLVDDVFIAKILEELKSMNQIKSQAMSRFISEIEDNKFEDII